MVKAVYNVSKITILKHQPGERSAKGPPIEVSRHCATFFDTIISMDPFDFHTVLTGKVV